MNYTLMQSAIADRLNRKDLTSQIQTWIYNARRNIVAGTLPIVPSPGTAYHRFSWAYCTTTLTATAGDDTIDFPAESATVPGFIDEIDMFIAVNNKPLVKSTLNEMDDSFYAANNSTTSGTPTNYSVLATEFKLYPVPSGGEVITLYYYGYPLILVNDSDEKTIDKKCSDLIIDLCCYDGGLYLHDKDLQMQFGEAAKNRYYNLVISDQRRKLNNRDMRMKTFRDTDISLSNGRKMI